MANTSRLIFLAVAVAAAGVHGYEVTSFEANPQQSELGSEVTLMAKAGFIFVHNLFSPRSKRSPFLNFTPTPQQNP